MTEPMTKSDEIQNLLLPWIKSMRGHYSDKIDAELLYDESAEICFLILSQKGKKVWVEVISPGDNGKDLFMTKAQTAFSVFDQLLTQQENESA
jgi:hypothetical protein